MKYSEQLRVLLSDEVLPEIEAFTKKMQSFADANGPSEDIEQDRAGLQAIEQNFLNILEAVERGEISESNCEELIAEIGKLRSMGSDQAL